MTRMKKKKKDGEQRMPNTKKVLKGLEYCAAMSGDACQKCPYGHECRNVDLPYGIPHLAADSLSLLKEQEAGIRELEEKLRVLECGDQDILKRAMMLLSQKIDRLELMINRLKYTHEKEDEHNG